MLSIIIKHTVNILSTTYLTPYRTRNKAAHTKRMPQCHTRMDTFSFIPKTQYLYGFISKHPLLKSPTWYPLSCGYQHFLPKLFGPNLSKFLWRLELRRLDVYRGVATVPGHVKQVWYFLFFFYSLIFLLSTFFYILLLTLKMFVNVIDAQVT